MSFNKILFVGHKYDKNSPEFGLIYYSFYKAIKNISNDLKSFFFEDYKNEERDLSLIKFQEKYQPDLIIFVYQLGQLEFKTLLKLKESKSITVNFYGDDCWRFSSFTLKTFHLFDFVVSFDDSKINEYKKNKISNVMFSQWGAVSKFKVEEISDEFDYDVTFIGAKTQIREWMIYKLKKNSINVTCFGKGWNNGIISFDKMKTINSRSKICLDLPNSISYDVRFIFKYPIGLYRLLKQFFLKNLKDDDGIKARIFEITSMGGLLVTYYDSRITNYFKIGKEIYCYNNINDLITLIKRILNNPIEAKSIRLKGFNRAINHHLYENRFIEIFDNIKTQISK